MTPPRSGQAIELGAGVGLVSLVAALRGATVIATDRVDNMGLLEHNVEANRFAGEVSAKPLSWGEEARSVSWSEEGFDLVLGAEIVYDARLFPALLATLESLLRAKEGAQGLIAYKERGIEERTFFDSLREAGWAVETEPLLGDHEYCLIRISDSNGGSAAS